MDAKREDIDYMYDNISEYIEKYGIASLLRIIIDILKVEEGRLLCESKSDPAI